MTSYLLAIQKESPHQGMNDEIDNITLLHSLKEVEKQLGWGAGEKWTTQDFADLSTKIFEKTGVALSVTTLKRLWGRVNYGSRPTAGTLNALVQFIGYENWQSYLQKYKNLADERLSPGDATALSGKKHKMGVSFAGYIWPVLIISTVLVGGFLLTNFYLRSEEPLTELPADSFRFEAKMMEDEGVPNTVIFNYDVSTTSSEDTIHIQQSWDESLREQVSRLDQIHRSIYYYPGFFQAKLLVNAKIVEERPLYIRTRGWLPLVEQEGSPVYFDESDAQSSSGVFQLPLHKIEEKNITLQPKSPWVSYFYVREFEDLKADNFIFNTRIKNVYNEGAAICQHAQIHLLFEGGAFVIPLSIKGCVGELMFYDVSGSIDDTEALGCDLSEWVDVQFKVQDRKGILYLNNRLAYEQLNFDLPPLAIVGLRFRFQGPGSVDHVRFSRINGTLVYQEDFEQPISVQVKR